MEDGSPISREPLRLLMYGAWRASPCCPACSRRRRGACLRSGPPSPLPHRPLFFASWRRDARSRRLRARSGLCAWMLREATVPTCLCRFRSPYPAMLPSLRRDGRRAVSSMMLRKARFGSALRRQMSSRAVRRFGSMGRLGSFRTTRGGDRGSCVARSVSSPFATPRSSASTPPCSIRFGRPCLPPSTRSVTMPGRYARASCAGARRTCRAARLQRCFPHAG